jgi:hypothetical protein
MFGWLELMAKGSKGGWNGEGLKAKSLAPFSWIFPLFFLMNFSYSSFHQKNRHEN